MKNYKNTFIFCFFLFVTSYAYALPSRFSPYADLTINTHWDAQYQDMEPMDLFGIAQQSGIKNYHLAFITDAGNCKPAWGGQSSFGTDIAWGKHLTDTLSSSNINYAISFGGASGNDLSLACEEDQLVTAYRQIIETYHPQTLDFDIENGTANISKILLALKQIQKENPKLHISFTLPVLPEGLVASGEDIVKQANATNLDFSVNIMAMDYGPAYTNSMGQYAIQAANNLFLFLKTLYSDKADTDLWHMIEITPMIGVNDVSVEQFTLADVDLLREFANKNHLGGLSMWSIARDNSCSDQWASPICSGNNLQTKSSEFAQRFLNL